MTGRSATVTMSVKVDSVTQICLKTVIQTIQIFACPRSQLENSVMTTMIVPAISALTLSAQTRFLLAELVMPIVSAEVACAGTLSAPISYRSVDLVMPTVSAAVACAGTLSVQSNCPSAVLVTQTVTAVVELVLALRIVALTCLHLVQPAVTAASANLGCTATSITTRNVNPSEVSRPIATPMKTAIQDNATSLFVHGASVERKRVFPRMARSEIIVCETRTALLLGAVVLRETVNAVPGPVVEACSITLFECLMDGWMIILCTKRSRSATIGRRSTHPKSEWQCLFRCGLCAGL